MTFDPMKHLSKLPKGGDYLEVKYRMVWFREENPNGAIISEIVEHEVGKYALFRATVTSEKGGVATDYGSETITDFKDYVEKASTKAIGRALAAAGYGTAFAPEFDTGISRATGEPRIADAPINPPRNGTAYVPQPERPSAPAARQDAPQRTEPAVGDPWTPPTGGAVPRPNVGAPASDRSRKMAYMVATRDCGIPRDVLYAWTQAMHGCEFDALSQAHMSQLIDFLKENNALPALPASDGAAAPSPVAVVVAEFLRTDGNDRDRWDAISELCGKDAERWVEVVGLAPSHEFLQAVQYQCADNGLYDGTGGAVIDAAIETRSKAM